MGIDKLANLPYTLGVFKGETMNKITIDQFIFICNQYLGDSTSSFIEFLYKKGYVDDTYNFSDSISIDSSALKDIRLNTQDIVTNKNKFKAIVEFFVKNNEMIEGKKVVQENFLKQITTALASSNTTLAISDSCYEKLSSNFDMYSKDMSVPKSHPKLNFLRKKVLIPSVIIGAGCGALSGIMSTVKNVANSSFVSPNVLANVASWASAGFLCGLVAVPAITMVVNKTTRAHYSKKYCQKSNNLDIMRTAYIQTLAELENSANVLPIKQLMEKIHSSNEKILINEKGNWFQRNITNRFFLKKIHRNQLWALNSYIHSLRQTAMGASATEEYNRCALMLDYIDRNLTRDMRENFTNYSVKDNKLNNSDIYATIMMGNLKKGSVKDIKDKCYNIVRTLSLEHYSSENPSETLFNLATSIDEFSAETVLDESLDAEQAVVANQEETHTVETEQATPEVVTEETAPVVEQSTTEEPHIVTEEAVESTEEVVNHEETPLLPKAILRSALRNPSSALSVKINDKYKTKYKVTINLNGETKKIDVRKSGDQELDHTLIEGAISGALSTWLNKGADSVEETTIEETSTTAEVPVTTNQTAEQLSIF